MAGNQSALSLVAIAAIGAATGGLALPALGLAASATGGALLGAATATSVFGTIQQGRAEAGYYKIQAGQQQLQLAADQAQAALDEEERQRQTTSLMATQRAIFGSSNISSSGVGDLITAKTMGETNRNTSLATTAGLTSTAQQLAGIAQSRQAGRAAREGSYVKATSSLLQFAGSRYDLKKTG